MVPVRFVFNTKEKKWDKIPPLKAWQRNAWQGADAIRAALVNRPKLEGLGVAHELSSTFALDIDTEAAHGTDGMLALNALEAEHGALPKTVVLITATGGLQFIFRRPSELAPLGSGNHDGMWPGIDVIGGFSVTPPSTYKLGSYTWHEESTETPVDPPAWLVEAHP